MEIQTIKPVEFPEHAASKKRWVNETELHALMQSPVDGTQINQSALQAHMRAMEQQLASVPAEMLRKAVQAAQIEQHNAEVDKAKAQRKQFRQMAKQARISTDALKRMIKSVQPAPAEYPTKAGVNYCASDNRP